MMKKQLLFCSLALASSMTAFANQGDVLTSTDQLENGKVYIVKPAVEPGRGTWRVNPDNLSTLSSTVLTGATMLDYNDPYQQFAFLQSSTTGHYYIYNTATDRFFAAGNNSVSLVERPMSDASYVTFATSTNTDAENLFLVALDGQYMNLNASQGVVFYGSGSTYTNDAGNSLQIIEAGDIDEAAKNKALDKINAFEAAYTEENKTATEALNTEVGGFLSVPQYAVGGYDPQLWQNLNDACGGDGVVDIYDYVNNATKIQECITALENAGTTSPEISNNKVYRLVNIVSSNGYLYSKQEDVFHVYSSAKSSNLTTVPNSDKWQLYTKDGYSFLYNQGTKGFAKYDSESNSWIFANEPTYFTVTENTDKGIAAFSIEDSETSSGIPYMHCSMGYTQGVVGWYADANASYFYFEEVEGTPVDLSTYPLLKLKSVAQDMIDSYDGVDYQTYVGAYRDGAIQTLTDNLAKENLTYEELKSAILTAREGQNPKAGQYYWIKNIMAFDDNQTKSIFENPDGSHIAWNSAAEEAKELWLLEDNGEGKYYIKSVNTGKYIAHSGATFVMGDANSKAAFVLSGRVKTYNLGLETYDGGIQYTMCLNTSNTPYQSAASSATSGGYVVSNNNYNNGQATQWNIIEATSVNLTIGETEYATAYFPFAVTIPEGVKAYTVSAAADGVATLSPLTGTIPANTGVILSGSAKTYPFAITTSTASAVEDNLLNGVTIATDLDPETSYILANGANGLGFYKVDPTDTKLAANKAYLNNANGSFFSLKLDGAVTGIQSVENAAENAPAYDLQGRRLPQVPTKGLYIQNGKKIMK